MGNCFDHFMALNVGKSVGKYIFKLSYQNTLCVFRHLIEIINLTLFVLPEKQHDWFKTTLGNS